MNRTDLSADDWQARAERAEELLGYVLADGVQACDEPGCACSTAAALRHLSEATK